MDKIYKYNGVEYLPRKKSFKPYRILAIQLLDKYNEFESSFTSSLSAEIQNFLFTDKSVSGSVISALNSGDKSKLNQAVTLALLSNPAYALKARQLEEKKLMANELFLTADNDFKPDFSNAKLLCEIMLEDSSAINHSPSTDEEYSLYLAFLKELFNDFFVKFRH